MRLEKNNPNEKRKFKKSIIIGTSAVAVLTLTGICGWSFFKTPNGNLIKKAQSIVSGPILQETLAISSEDENDSGMIEVPELQKKDVIALQYYLNRLGFGYSRGNMPWLNIGEVSENGEFETDKNGEYNKMEALYMLCTNKSKEDRPEHAYDPGEISEILYFTEYVPGDTMIDSETGKVLHYKAQAYFYDIGGIIMIQGEYVYAETESEAKKKANEQIQDKYQEYLDRYDKEKEKYEKWAEWRDARKKWMDTQYKNGYFAVKDLASLEDENVEWSTYEGFWTEVGLKVFGKNPSTSSESTKELINILYAQIYTGELDEEGNLIERENVLNLLDSALEYKTTGKEYPVYPAGKPTDPPTSTSPDTSGDGTLSGGNPVVGGDPGGEGPGGENPDSGDSGGEKPEESKLKVETATTMYPEANTYKTGQEIRIKVIFNEEMYGTDKKEKITKETAPKFSISFVEEGKTDIINKQAKFEFAIGKNIVYSYIIAEGDNGKLSLGTGDNFTGTVYDSAGRKVTLTKVEKLTETPVIVADTKAPSVKTIEAISPEKSYKTGEKIEIKVTFDEKVYSNESKVELLLKTAPILNISFGEGKVKNSEISSINNQENSITYAYTIQEEDKGNLKVESAKAFDGTRKIYDALGNGIELIKGVELTGNAVSANADLATIKLNKTELILDLKDKKEETLVATTKPEGLEVTWSTADGKVATVDSKTGKVTAVAIGETTITAKVGEATTATCKVTVKDGETKITLNKTSLELDLSGTKEEQLTAKVEPKEIEVTWTCSNSKVATVDSKTGKVTAVAIGETTITAKAKDGTIATCKVTVKDSKSKDIEPTAIEFVMINPTVEINRTKTLKMETRLIPDNSNKNTERTFESSNEKVATIDTQGNVTIKGIGTTVISVTTKNGKTAYTNLTVTEVKDDKKILGDVTQDGKIDSSDLLAVLRYIAATSSNETKIKHQDWLIEGEAYICADTDGNGKIDIADALKIQRHIAHEKSEIVKEKHPEWQIKTNWTNK